MRDLKSEIQSKVLNGIAKLGTVNIACVYQRMGTPTYDDGNTIPVVLSSTNLDLILSDYAANRSSGTDLLRDEEATRAIVKVAIFSSVLLPFEPSINDIIIDDTLTEWHVIGLTGDPAFAHHELLVRPNNNE